MSERPLLIVILAAGKGTRMKSSRPKVLHEVGGRSMLAHVMAAGCAAGATRLAVVVGPEMPQVRGQISDFGRKAGLAIEVFEQAEQRGTADAVLAAAQALENFDGDVLVLFADTPLITPQTLLSMRAKLDAGAAVVVVGFNTQDPTGYGRLIQDPNGALVAIREHSDANEAERAVRFCNSGVMGFEGAHLLPLLRRVGTANAKGEYYLTDLVELARGERLMTMACEAAEIEVFGVNSRAQLAQAEAAFQSRARHDAMDNGATLTAPETVFFSFDTRVGRDVVIEPGVFFGPGVVIGDDVEIKAFSHLEGASIGNGARIGPFARLRPGARLGADTRIGNFVEVKNVTMGDGAKANHLSYLGDGRVGTGVNIGAGTIFCNYDGYNKHKTEIGDGAFIGSNTSLVAPVTIGAGAYIGSGSVITRNVASDALALERSAQQERVGWAAKFRKLMASRSKAKP